VCKLQQLHLGLISMAVCWPDDISSLLSLWRLDGGGVSTVMGGRYNAVIAMAG